MFVSLNIFLELIKNDLGWAALPHKLVNQAFLFTTAIVLGLNARSKQDIIWIIKSKQVYFI